MLGAIFMATDYVTSPITALGQMVYGVGCGVLTVMIRYFGGYNEGVSYAILIMNCCVVLLDRIGRPTKFGAPRKEAVKR
jgi:electron transport complex protein RnfD